MLRAGVGLLFDGFAASDLSPIRFKRGADSVELWAMPGSSEVEVVQTDGAVRTIKTQDWICKVADLVLSGAPVEPRRGSDSVELLDDAGAVVRTYAVTHPTGGEPFRYCDQFRTLIRIQTVER